MNYKYIKYIPNILTICRFIFIPFIIISIGLNNYLLAIILYTLSSVTDVVDGAIARKFNVISDFGKLMDPLADKIFLSSNSYSYIKRNYSILDFYYFIFKRIINDYSSVFPIWKRFSCIK